MRIGYLGSGTWGFSLASLLASKGHQVIVWGQSGGLIETLIEGREHPKLPGYPAHPNVIFTTDLSKALEGAEMVVESVTSMGLRPVLEQVVACGSIDVPLVITSKGIEQNSCLLLPEVAVEVLGASHKSKIGCLTGPSHAEEVVRKLPTSVVSSAYDSALMHQIHDVFLTPFFRIYPNTDVKGVSFGGAMKNIIAIACGISDGLGFGDNTKAALLTRGLHEIRKLAISKGACPETLNGLSGLGDLCVTCYSSHGRNHAFGRLIAQGFSPEAAKERIGMVVEGSFTCVSALQLARKENIPVPITEAVHEILYANLSPRDAVKALLQREIKEEHL